MRKLRDTRGSTMIFAMAVFLVATIFSMTLLGESIGLAQDAVDAVELGAGADMDQQTYLTLQSAAALIQEAVGNDTLYTKTPTNIEGVCQVYQINNDNEEERLDTARTVKQAIFFYFVSALSSANNYESSFTISVPEVDTGVTVKVLGQETVYDIATELKINNNDNNNETKLIINFIDDETKSYIQWKSVNVVTPTPTPTPT